MIFLWSLIMFHLGLTFFKRIPCYSMCSQHFVITVVYAWPMIVCDFRKTPSLHWMSKSAIAIDDAFHMCGGGFQFTLTALWVLYGTPSISQRTSSLSTSSMYVTYLVCCCWTGNVICNKVVHELRATLHILIRGGRPGNELISEGGLKPGISCISVIH